MSYPSLERLNFLYYLPESVGLLWKKKGYLPNRLWGNTLLGFPCFEDFYHHMVVEIPSFNSLLGLTMTMRESTPEVYEQIVIFPLYFGKFDPPPSVRKWIFWGGLSIQFPSSFLFLRKSKFPGSFTIRYLQLMGISLFMLNYNLATYSLPRGNSVPSRKPEKPLQFWYLVFLLAIQENHKPHQLELLRNSLRFE